jgi:chaperonin GroES
MKVTPLYDRVLLKRLEEQEVKKGGIIIPDTAKEKPQQAEVIAVGKGRMNEDGKLIPLEIKKGDRVLIGKYSGSEVMIDDVEHVILKEDEILAKID